MSLHDPLTADHSSRQTHQFSQQPSYPQHLPFPNQPSNDNDCTWQGDNFHPDKDAHHTRVSFHNVNGLRLQGNESFDFFLQEQAVMQIDLLAISEHCLDTTKFQVMQQARRIAHRHSEGRVLLKLDSSSEPAVNQYKPGGTGIIAIGPITSRLETNGIGGDQMGRWSYLHFRRKNQPPLTIISVYQVCPSPTNPIGNTAYHQQQRLLNLSGRHNIHPRKAFQEDLHKFISDLKTKQHDILLGGDFNESLTDKKSGIHHLATTHNLIDPFLYRFPNHPPFGSHIKGSRRIDLILMSPRLLQSLRGIGYSPFYFSTCSDHRQIVIDFDTHTLFGAPQDRLQDLQDRFFRSNDRKAVTTFINVMYEEISQRSGFKFVKMLQDDNITPQDVETIDNLIGKCGDIAESKCKKRRSPYFSQKLVQHRIRVSILRGHLNSLKSHRDRTPQLQQRMTRLSIHVELPDTLHLTRKALVEARQKLQEVIQDNENIRQEELNAKISEATASNNKTKAKLLRNIKKVEMGKNTYRILRAMRKKQNSPALTQIEVPASWPPIHTINLELSHLEDPNSCQNWRTVTDPQEIEFYLVTRNRLHFGQAEGTPFTVSPLREDVDWAASSLPSDQILQGDYQINSSFRQCHELLQACKSVVEIDSLPAELLIEEFKSKIQSWRESTTTSPSGRHLGRYKALFAQGAPAEDTESEHETLLATKQEAISKLILALINYCLRNNHVLTRWKTIVNVMIPKEPQNLKIHRLRVIHIYEADFNLILAVKWRQLLRHADARKVINEGQYGGRPGCEAQSLTLLEELKYDLSYLTRRSLIHFDNDASSCYDRIIVSLSSLINRKYGLHRRVAALHANTLQQARFRPKTPTGTSTTCYSHSNTSPIHGTGQGSGNSPCIWLFISSTLFDSHAAQSHGATFTNPSGQSQVQLSMTGYRFRRRFNRIV